MGPAPVPHVQASLYVGDGGAPVNGGRGVVVPNRWQGEADCIVGPFSGRDVAAYFADRVVDFGQYEVFTMRVFARGNAWYVEVRRRAL